MRMKAVVMMTLVCVGTAGAALAADAANGEALFKKKCATCHNPDSSKKVGPGMAGVTDRRTDAWLDMWLADTKTVIATSKDPQVLEVIKGQKMKMPTVKEMTDPALRADMIAYLKKNDGK